jgi:hypothetical protein
MMASLMKLEVPFLCQGPKETIPTNRSLTFLYGRVAPQKIYSFSLKILDLKDKKEAMFLKRYTP